MLVAAALVSLTALLFLGGDRAQCLGPLGVTEVQCTAAWMATHPGWSPGPGGPVVPLLATISGLLLVLAMRPSVRSPRAVIALLTSAALGAATGAAAYEVIRPREMSGLTSSGQLITLVLPANESAQALAIALGATVAAAGMALALRRRPKPPRAQGVTVG